MFSKTIIAIGVLTQWRCGQFLRKLIPPAAGQFGKMLVLAESGQIFILKNEKKFVVCLV